MVSHEREEEIVRFQARPGVDFINILRAVFMFEDPKSEIKTVKLSIFLALLGSALVKAAHRMLMKLTPGLNILKPLGAY